MTTHQITKIKSKITKAQNQIDECQHTLKELHNLLALLIVSNTETSPVIKIGDYVISKTNPNKSKCGKVTSRTDNYITITPDDPNDKSFRKAAPHNLAIILPK